MSYTIKYDRESATGRRRSIIDLIQYVGMKRTKILMRAVRKGDEIKDEETFRFYASFAGVQGFPVESLWVYLKEGSRED